MSGPSLRKLHSHRSIHDGAYSEAQNMTEMLTQLYRDGRREHARLAAEALLEHWETRTLAHAEAEEEGFYQEVLTGRPELAEQITKLTRDHDLLRKIVAQTKGLLEEHDVNEEILSRFTALLLINSIHSRDEESSLLA
ncbi:hemerythrin domain-containing protein [Brevibacillus sp. SYSU BS000544]|uniref:hemerythrin domain-containing protein n=1 Tax=Brevibacillus sp. SYSU BS000544 TaxID=3416443 RepID=UPI003CE529EB